MAAVSPSLAACHARDAPQDAGAAAAQDWPAALHARFGAGGSASPAVARTGPASAQLTVPQASLRGVLAWLAAQPAVQWVGAPGEPLLANYQAITIDQIGDATSRVSRRRAADGWMDGWLHRCQLAPQMCRQLSYYTRARCY